MNYLQKDGLRSHYRESHCCTQERMRYVKLIECNQGLYLMPSLQVAVSMMALALYKAHICNDLESTATMYGQVKRATVRA